MRHRLAVMREGWLTATRDAAARTSTGVLWEIALADMRRARSLRGARRGPLRQGDAAGRRRGRRQAGADLFRRECRAGGRRRRTISPACSRRRGVGICRTPRSRSSSVCAPEAGVAAPSRAAGGVGAEGRPAALRHASPDGGAVSEPAAKEAARRCALRGATEPAARPRSSSCPRGLGCSR